MTMGLKALKMIFNPNAHFIESADNKIKDIWSIINNERKGQQLQFQICIANNNEEVENPTKIADHFKTFLTQVAE